MNTGLVIRIFLCILTFSTCLHFFVLKQNELTELRIQVPAIKKQIHLAQERRQELLFEIEKFENPMHLMEWARRPEFAHLKYPLTKDILTIHDPIPPSTPTATPFYAEEEIP